ncbi:MAG: S80 family phage morphogenetic serine protease [Bacteroidales bacterium]
MNMQPYLILERSAQNLKSLGDSKKTILEGIFAEFGVENRNGRIYNEDQYLKHLTYLKKDIEQGSLLGELDHPDRYEVSLSNASHRIVELWYDAKTRRVMGRIEILENTPRGQIAKALLDAGVQLSISSRAAGTVNPDKTVNIHQIYTYDLVAKPGFASAQLYAVTESVSDSKLNAYLSTINESTNTLNKISKCGELGIHNDLVSIIAVSESAEGIKYRAEALDINKNNNTNNMDKETEKITKPAVDIVTDKPETNNSEVTELKEEVNRLKDYINELRKIQECALDWQSDIAKGVNTVAKQLDTVSKKANKHIKITEQLSEAVNYNADVVNKMSEWTSSIATTTNYLAETVDYNANVVNHMQDWQASQAVAINQMSAWTGSIAENLNLTMNYAEKSFGKAISKEDAKCILEYTEALINKEDTKEMRTKIDESLSKTSISGIEVMGEQKPITVPKMADKGKDTSVKFDEKSKTIVAKGVKIELKKGKLPKELSTLDDKDATATKLGDGIKDLETLVDTKPIKVPEDADKGVDKKETQQLADLPSKKGANKTVAPTYESFDKSKEITQKKDKLSNELGAIYEKLCQEQDTINKLNSEYPFTRFLSKQDAKKYAEMSSADKVRINEEMSKLTTTDPAIIQKLWESATTVKVTEDPLWLTAAPAKYKAMFESASEVEKNRIRAKAEYLDLSTQYRIDNFWSMQSKLNEHSVGVLNEHVIAKPQNNEMGAYSSDFIKQIGERLKSYN